MITTVTATYAKNNLGELMDRVISSKKKILIRRAGRPAVYMVPVASDFKLDFTDAEFDKLELGMKEFRDSFKFNF